jgi:hypothetical protein
MTIRSLLNGFDLGQGYQVWDTDHHFKYECDIGFTMEGQENFFEAIKNCDHKTIKDYLHEEITKTKDGAILRGGSLPKYDINGTFNDDPPIIILAKKYNSLKYKQQKINAITILEDLLLAHIGNNQKHKKIMIDDIYKANSIAEERNKGNRFSTELHRICKIHHDDYYDLDENESEGEKSGQQRNGNPKIVGLRISRLRRRGGFVLKKPTKEEVELNTRITSDPNPQTSPAGASAKSAATVGTQTTTPQR